jgi:hypothetical protein
MDGGRFPRQSRNRKAGLGWLAYHFLVRLVAICVGVASGVSLLLVGLVNAIEGPTEYTPETVQKAYDDADFSHDFEAYKILISNGVHRRYLEGEHQRKR